MNLCEVDEISVQDRFARLEPRFTLEIRFDSLESPLVFLA